MVCPNSRLLCFDPFRLLHTPQGLLQFMNFTSASEHTTLPQCTSEIMTVVCLAVDSMVYGRHGKLELFMQFDLKSCSTQPLVSVQFSPLSSSSCWNLKRLWHHQFIPVHITCNDVFFFFFIKSCIKVTCKWCSLQGLFWTRSLCWSS